MEKLYDTSKSVHDKIVRILTKKLNVEEIKKIIDAGSGKTSASILLKYFPKAVVDAVVYPGDNRKKNPLENEIGSNRLDVIEMDLCAGCIRKKYDLCMVYLTLGEALNFNNIFEKLFHQIMCINIIFQTPINISINIVFFCKQFTNNWSHTITYKFIASNTYKNRSCCWL